MAAMRAASLFFSSSGRLAPGPFAVAVTIVYVVNFLSQMLLSAAVTGQVGLWAFAILQVVLVWGWVVLHVKRLRDAGRSAAMAYGIACLYGLTVVLVLLVVAMISATETSSQTMQTGQGLIRLFIVIYLFAMLVQAQELGAMAYWLMGFVAVLLLPLLIAFAYSVWAATRPAAPPAAAAATAAR
jgi:uncharacterized membrane protein YhaH (DUF805 family)